MTQITLPAYAKINLFLEVLSRREDGYHLIDTVMQTVSLCDNVTVTIDHHDNGITLSCNDPTVPCDGTNIATKCASAYLDYCRLSWGVKIEIEKKIPISAGLGGGSSDGGAVLRALNALNPNPISVDELTAIGGKIGADIPFCTVGGVVRCQGIGDVFSPATGLSEDCFIVIAKGKQGSDTKKAYQAIDKMKEREIRTLPEIFTDSTKQNGLTPKEVCASLYNSFEPIVLPSNRDCSAIRRSLSILGAKGCLMSGSGSSVFGIFEDEKKAKAAALYLADKGFFAGVFTPVGALI